jgi:aspartyl protease family protein
MRRLPFPGGSTSPSGVGHFRVSIEIGRRGVDRFMPLQAMVDTGSTYTWVPRDLLSELGVTPEQEWPFELADGRAVRYPVSWIQIRLEGREQPTIVVFAPPGTEPILGVVTLEEFLLAADPVNERLISVPGLAKRAS